MKGSSQVAPKDADDQRGDRPEPKVRVVDVAAGSSSRPPADSPAANAAGEAEEEEVESQVGEGDGHAASPLGRKSLAVTAPVSRFDNLLDVLCARELRSSDVSVDRGGANAAFQRERPLPDPVVLEVFRKPVHASYDCEYRN